MKVIFNGLCVVFVFYLLYADAKGRKGGRVVLHTSSSSDSSGESSSNSVGGILGIILFLFCCGCGICWRFFECWSSEEQQKRQYIHANASPELAVDRFNKSILPKDLSYTRTDINPPMLILVTVQSFDDASQPLQPVNKEEKSSPIEEVETLSRIN